MKSHQIPWLRVFVEGAVIVVSVLLALAADAWWDRVQQHREERLRVVALTADFAENVELLADTDASLELRILRLTELRDLLRENQGCSEILVPNESLIALLRGTGTIDLRTGVLDAMIGSGRLDQLSEPTLRDLLSSWPRLVSDVRTDQLQRQGWVNDELVPLMAGYGDYSRVFAFPIAEDLRSGSTSVPCDSQLLTMVAAKLVMDQWTHRDLGPLTAATSEILDLLRAWDAP